MQYIIVEKNNNENFVILGPMNWRPTYFKNCLFDDLEIEFDVPLSNDDGTVVVVNENVLILPVVELPINQEYNSKIQFPQGPYYNFYETYAEIYYIPEDKNIDIVKTELKAQVAANRYQYEVKGITTTIQEQEVFIWTNREDRALYLQAYQLGANNVGWKFGSKFLTVTNAELGQIVSVCMAHVQAVFDWEGSVVSSINAATTLSELDLISTESDNPNWNPPLINPNPEV